MSTEVNHCMQHSVYLAGPLFTTAERQWNAWLATKLRGDGFKIVLPQEEAAQSITDKVINYASILSICLTQVRQSTAVIAVFDGPDVDSGTALECGYAHALNVPIVGVRSDLRSGGQESGVNTMLKRCCTKFVAVPAWKTPDTFRQKQAATTACTLRVVVHCPATGVNPESSGPRLNL